MNGTTYRNALAIAALALASSTTLPAAQANDARNTGGTVAVAETAAKTSAEVWKAIDADMAKLKAVVAGGKLGEAHEHAFAVRDLVRTLPDHSPGLKPEALARIKANVKFVDTLATRIDKAGDANDKAGTQEALSKMENVLKAMRSEYPA